MIGAQLGKQRSGEECSLLLPFLMTDASIPWDMGSCLTPRRCLAQVILATHVPGTPHGKLPWVELLIADMRALQRGARGKLDGLDCPVECAAAWHSLVLRFPGAWRDLVRAHHATTTEADTNLLRRTACGPCVADRLRP